MITDYQSKFFAHQLTKRLSSDDPEKLSQTLFNATVDLNPHQVEAALFAFRSPLSRGALLADEVGLGKTIEAGLIMSQLWAERKRRILCIVPAAIRKQWNRELLEKFFIDSTILEAKSYNKLKKMDVVNPFDQPGTIVICSFQFAKSKIEDVQRVLWDLVCVDEAHRLRNVYKKTNKIARAIRDAIQDRPKILLTATPLQNSLMELFGLVSFLDPHLFGSEESFRSQYATRSSAATDTQLAHLRGRIAPVCQRTLRRQVTEYVPYTNRISITQDFTPTADEVRLYDAVSDYLQRPELVALPSGQRQLITLVLRKILASSSFAIGSTLGKMVSRLRHEQKEAEVRFAASLADFVGDDIDEIDELEEEWSGGNEAGDSDDEDEIAPIDPVQQQILIQRIGAEIAELQSYANLAQGITENAKGTALITALEKGFEKARELNAPEKALIFTESRRTQLYLTGLLEGSGYRAQVATFNGTNTDPRSKQIYKDWLDRHEGEDCVTGSASADMRSALVEYFRDEATIMIATESAAEGVNLQFCNLVVNYDLPWNPQRVEQRIGRCHRYGQKHDVVVINFINRSNEADQRVFQLLSEKFRLFDGVFGASDHVLGTLESGVDFERRISEIYQQCRSPVEINRAFDELQQELEDQINIRMEDTRTKLLENFDEDVRRTLRMGKNSLAMLKDRFTEWLWALTIHELSDYADIDEGRFSFTLRSVPESLPDTNVSLGHYRMIHTDGASSDHHYRFGHPLVAAIIDKAKERELPPREISFNHTDHPSIISIVEQRTGQSGWLRASLLSVASLETEQTVITSAFSDNGESLDAELCQRLLGIQAKAGAEVNVDAATLERLDAEFETAKSAHLEDARGRDLKFFQDEEEKFERWAEDVKDSLETELKEIASEVRTLKRESRAANNLEDKIALQKRIRDMEKKQNQKRKHLFDAQDQVDQRRDALISQTHERLKQSVETEHLFTIRWSVV